MTSAKEAGITILNEVGVDPGIDHMLAMECFDQVKNLGGKVSLDQGHVKILDESFFVIDNIAAREIT